MEIEKVKEIKLALEGAIKISERRKQDVYLGPVKVSEILEYINELESENERLSKQLPPFAERVKMEFYYQFDEIIPSIMADKIDEILNKY